MNVVDSVTDISPDAKMLAFGYGGYQVLINKLINTGSRDVFKSEDQTESIRFEELNNIALGIAQLVTGYY